MFLGIMKRLVAVVEHLRMVLIIVEIVVEQEEMDYHL
jgi:hypothetical protein